MAIYNSAFFPYKRRISLSKRYMYTKPNSRNFNSHYEFMNWYGEGWMPRNFLPKNMDRYHVSGYNFQKRIYYG